MAKLDFEIAGMDCAEEVEVLRREIAPLPGIEELGFDVLGRTMTVRFDGQQVKDDELLAAIGRAGLSGKIREATGASYDAKGRRGPVVSTATSAAFVAAAIIVHALTSGWKDVLGAHVAESVPVISRLLYGCAALAGGWFVLPRAFGAVRRYRPDINLLMVVAVAGAFAIGEYLEGAAVAFLFALSLSLEAWSVDRARRAIGALMQLAPTNATLLDSDGRESVVRAADVSVGSTVIVKPGEKFPLDGRILRGETTVNQAPITGESIPVAKSAGSEVFAGTINEEGAVEVETTKPATDSTLAKIIQLVGDAQSKRSPSEQWVDSFARYYTPAVMVLAIVVMVAPPLLLGGAWTNWFYQGLVLLVIACPCALVISTPVSIVAALTSAARQGVLIKGGPYVEVPAKLRAIAFDKTGTLTVGRPDVREIIPLSGHSEHELLGIAAAIESRSQHPLAQAILRAAQAAGIQSRPADDFQAISGKGATARIGGRSVWLGSHRLLEERGQETPEMHASLEEFAVQGCSVVVIGENDHVCGLIAVADQLRPQTKHVLASIRDAGIARLVLLTGDNRATGEAIGKAAGVDEVRAELLPQDKVEAIEDMMRQYEHVAMVGDGVNDAPALARASLGIAMGGVGTDAALETADITLMTDDLSRLAWLVRHSRQTLAIIRQNIFASLGVKAAFVALTLTGHASLWAAIAADTGMSLLVIFNSLRLLQKP